jgi:hypothetical protein
LGILSLETAEGRREEGGEGERKLEGEREERRREKETEVLEAAVGSQNMQVASILTLGAAFKENKVFLNCLSSGHSKGSCLHLFCLSTMITHHGLCTSLGIDLMTPLRTFQVLKGLFS